MTLINPDEHKSENGECGPNTTIKLRTPKRILHFSDGVLEEYSDEEEVDSSKKEEQLVDPSTLTWAPWLWYKAWRAGVSTVAIIDSIGEFLAAFFGITTPRYYFELEEYKRQQAENKKKAEENRGWSGSASGDEIQMSQTATTQQPTSSGAV